MARSHTLSAVVAVLGCLLSAPASASPTYPATIQSDLALEQVPACTLCHRDNLGGTGTVVSPFGRTMIDHFQLTGGNNVGALKAALATSDEQHLDSDGDGVSDIDELRMGTDPNVGVSGVQAAPDVPLPETGCAFVLHPQGGSSRLFMVTLALLGLCARRSRRS